jgi:hypothetical protein
VSRNVSFRFSLYVDTLDAIPGKAYTIANNYFGETPYEIVDITANADMFITNKVMSIRCDITCEAVEP